MMKDFFSSVAARLGIVFLVASLGLLVDLVTKYLAFSRLGLPGENPEYWIIPKVLAFQTSLNQGALFGIGQGMVPVFATLSLFALGAVGCWIIWDSQKSRSLALVLGMISGGILGNLFDRLGFHGLQWNAFMVASRQCPIDSNGQTIHAVRDWILVMIGSYHWPNFNVADSLLVSGAVLIALMALFQKNPPRS